MPCSGDGCGVITGRAPSPTARSNAASSSRTSNAMWPKVSDSAASRTPSTTASASVAISTASGYREGRRRLTTRPTRASSYPSSPRRKSPSIDCLPFLLYGNDVPDARVCCDAVKLTHLGHACLLVETGARLLVDPGTMSDFAGVRDLDAVLVTHQHRDHLDVTRLAALLAANPGASLVVDVDTAATVAGLPEHVVVEPGDRLRFNASTVD